jgi:hypothetical protein
MPVINATDFGCIKGAALGGLEPEQAVPAAELLNPDWLGSFVRRSGQTGPLLEPESTLAVPVCWLCSAAQVAKLPLVFSVTLMPPVNLGDSRVLTGLAQPG